MNKTVDISGEDYAKLKAWYAAQYGPGEFQGDTWVPAPKPREVLNILQTMATNSQPPTQEEWNRVIDAVAEMGPEAFKAHYFKLWANPGLKRADVEESFDRAFKQITQYIRANEKNLSDTFLRQNSPVNKPHYFAFTEGGFFALGCGHDHRRERIEKELALANGNPILCVICGKPSDFGKVKAAFYQTEKKVNKN